jgi:peptidoglycan/xylan/chitin deacetylase (PgdA/CDA1 family)
VLLWVALTTFVPATLGAAEDPHAVVFMYHRFGEDRYPSTSVRLEQFEAHLQFLAENDYRVWPLEQVVEHLKTGQAIPEHTVVITVDDAYLSTYTKAYPRLKERG